MRRPPTLAAVLFAGLLLVPAAAARADQLVKTVTPDDVLAFLRANDVQALLPVTPTHRPAVQARLGDRPGMVFLYDCEGTRCGSLKFFVFIDGQPKHDLAFLNAWNGKRRYAPAYLYDGKVNLSHDLDLRGGVTSAGLLQALRTFEFLVRDFATFTP